MVETNLVAQVALNMLFPGNIKAGEPLKDPVDVGRLTTLFVHCLEVTAWPAENGCCPDHHFLLFLFEKKQNR